MNEVNSTQVRQVQKYSVYARATCSLLIALLAVSVGIVLFALLDNPESSHVGFVVGGLKIAANQVNTSARTWLLTITSSGLVCSAAMIWMLRRIFDNLSRGEIFSMANVSELRRISLMVLLIGVGQILLPFGNAVLSANGSFGPAQVAISSGFRLPGLLTPFAVAGLVYLASWIMRVGLGVSDEAAELRRDAELVV